MVDGRAPKPVLQWARATLQVRVLEGPLSRSTASHAGHHSPVSLDCGGPHPGTCLGCDPRESEGRLRGPCWDGVATLPPPGRRRPGVLPEEVYAPPEAETTVSCSWTSSIFGGPFREGARPLQLGVTKTGGHKGITDPQKGTQHHPQEKKNHRHEAGEEKPTRGACRETGHVKHAVIRKE